MRNCPGPRTTLTVQCMHMRENECQQRVDSRGAMASESVRLTSTRCRWVYYPQKEKERWRRGEGTAAARTGPAAWRSGAAWPRAWTGGLGLGHAAAAHRRHRPGRRCRGAGVRGGTAARSSAARPSRGSRPSCRRLPSTAPRSVIGLSTVLLPHKARPGAAKLMLLHASLALP